MEKKVSIYFNTFVKSALERETLYYKNLDIDGPRATIFKNIEFILRDFINTYQDNISEVSKLIYLSINKNIEENKLSAYPVLLEEDLLEKVEEIRLNINEKIGIKINKINFFNFILLSYYIQKREEILKRELEFWNQDYFKKGKQD